MYLNIICKARVHINSKKKSIYSPGSRPERRTVGTTLAFACTGATRDTHGELLGYELLYGFRTLSKK